MSSEQLVLPELILERIFSFLPARDLKNVRLVSTRMDRAVLDCEKRFRTWKVKISSYLKLDTEKVSRHNIKIEVGIYSMVPELDSWLIKHSSCITGITMFQNMPQKVIDILGELRQVRKLEHHQNIKKYEVKTLLSSLGPQLESLTVGGIMYDGFRNFNDLSSIDLSNLKHLELRVVHYEKETISSFLKIVPSTIESLILRTREIEFPSGMDNRLNNLKTLEIDALRIFTLPTKFLSKSLTRLDLGYVDLMDLEPVDTDLPSLKILGLYGCKIKMRVLNNAAQSVDELILSEMNITDYGDLECSLPVLTKLEVRYGLEDKPCNWLPQLIVGCSRSLTTLRLHRLSCDLGQLACDLPTLKVLAIFSCMIDVNHLLSKCSSSLQILYLYYMDVVLDVNVPNLKELHLENNKIEGFTKLVSPQGSSLETIGLKEVTGSFWADIARCRFENLKVVYMINLNPDEIEKLKMSINTPHEVQFITDPEEWYHHKEQCIPFTHFY